MLEGTGGWGDGVEVRKWKWVTLLSFLFCIPRRAKPMYLSKQDQAAALLWKDTPDHLGSHRRYTGGAWKGMCVPRVH